MKVFPDERGLLVILNSRQHDLLLKQANSGDVNANNIITQWREIMRDLLVWEHSHDTSANFVVVRGERGEGYSIHGLEVFKTYNAAVEAAMKLAPDYLAWTVQDDFTLDDGVMPCRAWLSGNGVDYVAILPLGVRP